MFKKEKSMYKPLASPSIRLGLGNSFFFGGFHFVRPSYGKLFTSIGENIPIDRPTHGLTDCETDLSCGNPLLANISFSCFNNMGS